MNTEFKKILIFGATSDIATAFINLIIKNNVEIFAVSRRTAEIESPNFHQYIADLSNEKEINGVFNLIQDEKFDAVVCFQGLAISSPVEFLEKGDLQKQLDISLFSLLSVLKNIRNKINPNGVVINISSMAAFGIYPFLSPYSISKASSDILLSCFEMETGIKTVSIKPGVVGTKFWNFCVNENEKNFEKCKETYKDEADFLKINALKNSSRGLKSKDVAKLIEKIIYSKNTTISYLIGYDSYLTAFASFFKGRILFNIIRKVLNKRTKRLKNE